MELSGVVEELYSGSPEAFVARRTELAREARAAKQRELATQVAALRRPSRAAWLVNLLAREPDSGLAGLLELGPQLAEMHVTGTPAQLRELGQLRRQVLGALVSRAVALGAERGYRASEPVRQEVQTCLEAALAHPQAAEGLLGGALVAAPESAAAFPLELFQQMPDSGVPAPPEPVTASASETGSEALAPVIDLQQGKQQRAARERERAHRAAVHLAREELSRARGELRRVESSAEQAAGAVVAAEERVRELADVRAELEREVGDLARRRRELEEELAAVRARQDEVAARLSDSERQEVAAHESADAAHRAREQAASEQGEVARLVARLAEALEALVEDPEAALKD